MAEVTAADRAVAKLVRRQIERRMGFSSGWAFFNPDAVEEPIAQALASARAEERARIAAWVQSLAPGWTCRCQTHAEGWAPECIAAALGGAREAGAACDASCHESVAQSTALCDQERERADALQARVVALEAALRTIERWKDFPPSGKRFEQSGTPMPYGVAFGSHGERDYMRHVARVALAPRDGRA